MLLKPVGRVFVIFDLLDLKNVFPKKPHIEQILGSAPPPFGVKTPLPHLTKILDPPLTIISSKHKW